MAVSTPTLSWWLKVTAPVWGKKHVARASQEALELEADVCIVGAGITGCALAYHLRRLRPGMKICLLEARGVSEGATGRNGGLMFPGLNAPWPATVQRFGMEGAQRLMGYEHHAFEDVVRFIHTHGQDACNFSFFPDGGLTLFESKGEQDATLSDTQLQVAAGFPRDSIPLDHDKLSNRLHTSDHPYLSALYHPGVARVTAAALTRELLSAAADVPCEPDQEVGAGAGQQYLTVLEHTTVTKVENMYADEQTGAKEGEAVGTGQVPSCSKRMRVTAALADPAMPDAAAREVVVMCGTVVHCTNGYNTLLPALRTSGWLTPVRNQVAVTAPLPADHPLPHAAFSSRDGYVYFSRRADNRIVIGGFRNLVPHMEIGVMDDTVQGLDPYISSCLRAYLPSSMPTLFAPSQTKTALPAKAEARMLGHMAGGRADACACVDGAGCSHDSADNTAAAAAEEVAQQVQGLSVEQLSAAAAPCPHNQEHDHAVEHHDVVCEVVAGVSQTKHSAAAPVELCYEMEWSGILGFTKDRWPLVGRLPGSVSAAGAVEGPSHEWCCMGFTGHGMTRAYNCARNCAHMLLGIEVEPQFPADVFSPDRMLSSS